MTLRFGPSDIHFIYIWQGESLGPSLRIFKAHSFSLPKYHLVKIFISIYSASDNCRIIFSTVKWTTWNVYRFSPDRALGGLEPFNSNAELRVNCEYNNGERSVSWSRVWLVFVNPFIDRLSIKCNEVCHSRLHRFIVSVLLNRISVLTTIITWFLRKHTNYEKRYGHLVTLDVSLCTVIQLWKKRYDQLLLQLKKQRN